MPRPLVEVRQAVLNPVVTINDPQQEVCLIGLHTDDYVDHEVYELDRPFTASTNVHFAAAINETFEIDADGVLIDSALDMGPDAYDIPADLTLNLSEAHIAKLDLPDIWNGTFGPFGHTANIVNLATTIATLPAYIQTGDPWPSYVYIQPKAAHCNKLVVSEGSAIDFTTHDEFKDLSNGDAIYFGTDTFYILKKEADAIYLRGNDTASHDFLVSTVGFTLLNPQGADIVSLNQHRFSLVHPGVHRARANSRGAAIGSFEIDPPAPFLIRKSEAGDTFGTLLNEVPATDLAALAISEGGASMTITPDSTGDATVLVDATQLVYDALPIVKAKFTLSYTVAKTVHSAGLVKVNADNLVATLGTPTPRNPLSLAASVALDNSGGSSVSVLALNISPEEGETVLRTLEEGFSDALTLLNRHSSVYAMVPLTNNATTIKAYANAAEALSLPKKGKFRVCLGSSKGAPLVDFIIGSELSPARLGSNTAGNVLTNGAGDLYNLPSNRVLAGDSIVATTTNGTLCLGSVSSVTNNTSLVIAWETAAAKNTAVNFSGYYIGRSLAPRAKISRQIEILTAEATAIASKRLFLTFPGSCTVTASSGTYVDLPSYYVTAAFAGLLTRLEVHRPKNFTGLTGITALEHWNRFSDDELDEISDAGYLVFQQDEATSAPFCIHQVNTYHGTQAGTQEFTELSVLANFDFISRYMKEVLDPFAGTVNIVPSTLGVIRASLEAAIDNLVARKQATIGSPLISGSVQYIRQASYDQGTVEASVLVSLPKVLNKIILEVVSG